MRIILCLLALVIMVLCAGYVIASDSETRLYVEPDPVQLQYPELFRSEAVVLVLSADWCVPCRVHKANLKRYVPDYNIQFVKIDDENGRPTKWRDYMSKNKLPIVVPTTVVVVKGEVKRVFRGITSWRVIKPHAEKARKQKVE